MDDYDVVVDALQRHREKLWKMTNRNMNSECFTLNITDDIRFYQIEQLDAAIAAHKNKKEWVGLTDDERLMCLSYDVDQAITNTEAKLKEKNNA
jgi:hypothetical protein